MKLSFRGIHYDYEPIILEPSDQAIEGTYRGVHWKNRPYEKPRHRRGIKEMIYRGIHYIRG